MDESKQLVTVPEREPLTEFEARRVGEASLRLPRLRRLLKDARKPLVGSITVGSGYQAGIIHLGSAQIIVALEELIRRDELFLASFNVKIERPE